MEQRVPITLANAMTRAGLVVLLGWAERMAVILVGQMPAVAAVQPQQVLAPLAAHAPEPGTLGGWPPVAEWPASDPVEPLVPRRPAPEHPRAPYLPG